MRETPLKNIKLAESNGSPPRVLAALRMKLLVTRLLSQN